MKYTGYICNFRNPKSPSIRREWIEMDGWQDLVGDPLSPSIRREWIEISSSGVWFGMRMSPSIRREWIEITRKQVAKSLPKVSLHTEGVD